MKIIRKSSRPQAALNWLAQNGMKDVATENVIEVRSEGARAVINLSGSIGKSWWDDTGITAEEFDKALNEIPAGKQILLRINSEGGSVKEGLGIYDSIAARSKDITARNVGYALSIASVFPLAASRIESPDHAIWMTHEGWMSASGNKRDMRKNAEMLDTHDKAMAGIYAKRSGKSADYWAAKMENETWFTGAEAIDAGLADETGETSDVEAAERRPIFAEYLASCKNIPANIYNMLAPNSAAPKPAGNNNQTNQESIMNKKIIVALLLSHGINNATTGKPFAETDVDADFETGLNALAKKKEAAPVPAAKKTEGDDDIRAQLTALKRDRVNDKITPFVDDQKITKAEAKMFLAQAMTSTEAEAEVFEILAAKQSQQFGGDAAGAHIISIEDGPAMSKNGIQGSKVIPELDNIFAASLNDGEKRYNLLKAEFPRLLKAAFRRDNGVMAENTFSGTVTTNFLIMAVIQKLQNRFAAANLFTRDNSQDPFKPLAAGIQKFNTTATDGSDVDTNLTDFENGGDSVISAITITPAQYTSKGHLTNSQLNSGYRIGDIIEKKLVNLAAKVQQVLMAPITVENFVTNPAVTSAPAAFGMSDLANLQGILKKTQVKNLILDGEYIARIANQPGFFQKTGTGVNDPKGYQAYGWDNIALNTDWSGAGANVRGFGCGQDAIGIITGLPLTPPTGIPGNTVQQGVAMLPDVGIGIQTNVWFSARYRTLWFSFDIIAGATLVDEAQGVIIKSA